MATKPEHAQLGFWWLWLLENFENSICIALESWTDNREIRESQLFDNY